MKASEILIYLFLGVMGGVFGALVFNLIEKTNKK